MQRYESYKPSGIQWVEKIPSHWGVERAKWLFDRMERPVRPEDDVVTAFRDGQVTLRTNRRTEGFTNAIQEHGYQGIRKGDLVIHAMDAFAGAIGVSDSDGKSTPVYAACVPRREYPVNSYYYAYLLRYMAHSGYIESLSKGIRERSTDFRFTEFRELPLPIPNKDEQDRIVAFLDQKTAEIDSAIAKKERLIELLNEQKLIFLNTALTRGLKSDQHFKDSDSPWLGLIPENWEMIPLAGFMSFISYGFTNPMPTEDDGPYMLTSNDIGDGSIRLDTARRTSQRAFDWKLTGKSKPNRGDILVTKDGTLGRTALVDTDEPICISQSVALLRPKKDTNPEFITAALRAECYLRKMIFDAGGTTIKHIYITRLGKMRIATPPPKEQLLIVQHCKELETHFHTLVSAEDKNIAAMRELKSALISAVVTGNVKV